MTAQVQTPRNLGVGCCLLSHRGPSRCGGHQTTLCHPRAHEGLFSDRQEGTVAADPRPCPLPAHHMGHRPRQLVGSSAHPRVVVSTTQEDWDESSSFLMERLLQLLPPSGTDFVSAGRRGVSAGARGIPQGQMWAAPPPSPGWSMNAAADHPALLVPTRLACPGQWVASSSLRSCLHSCLEGSWLWVRSSKLTSH